MRTFIKNFGTTNITFIVIAAIVGMLFGGNPAVDASLGPDGITPSNWGAILVFFKILGIISFLFGFINGILCHLINSKKN